MLIHQQTGADSDSASLGSNPSPPATQFVELASELGGGHFSHAGTIGQRYRTKVGTLTAPHPALSSDVHSAYE